MRIHEAQHEKLSKISSDSFSFLRPWGPSTAASVPEVFLFRTKIMEHFIVPSSTCVRKTSGTWLRHVLYVFEVKTLHGGIISIEVLISHHWGVVKNAMLLEVLTEAPSSSAKMSTVELKASIMEIIAFHQVLRSKGSSVVTLYPTEGNKSAEIA